MYIRRAVAKDIPELLRLLCQVNNVHADIRPDLFCHDKTKYTEEELVSVIRSDDTPVFVCFEDENSAEMLGYCISMYETKSGHSLKEVRTLYLDDICVDSKARGRGVGTAIYQYVRSYAKKNEVYNITLNVWEHNDSAIAFYKAMGLNVLKYGMEDILN